MEKNSGDPLRNQQLHLRTRRLVPSRERPASPPEFSKPSRLTCRGCITPMWPTKLPHFFKRRCNYSALQLINPGARQLLVGTYSIDLKGISGCFWFEHRQLEAFVQKLALTMLVPGMTCQKERVVLNRFTARAPRGFYRFVVDAGANV